MCVHGVFHVLPILSLDATPSKAGGATYQALQHSPTTSYQAYDDMDEVLVPTHSVTL